VRVGTAGWQIPAPARSRAPAAGSLLERYAGVLSGVEINSSFYRSHATATYARWRGTTPDSFRFAVKLPRAITHDQELRASGPALAQFLAEIAGLGPKLGPVLAQLPPALAFDRRVASRFFDGFRRRFDGAIVCEPRHPTWFDGAAERVFMKYRIARVAADPPRAARDGRPGGWPDLAYYRLHGAPRTYWSAYDEAFIHALAASLAANRPVETWVIFDNTAAGAAFGNAVQLQDRLAAGQR
jgi:uncharacterized protein YecE (DUF72 family)